MWIRSQDKKQVLNVLGLGITKVFGGKKKGVIIAYMETKLLADLNNYVVAQYDTAEEAVKELDRFEEHLINTPNEVYKLR